MHRIDTATRATDLFGAGKDGWRDGNKGAGTQATDCSAAFFNDVQENMSRVIEAAGFALVKGDGDQLRQAIVKMIQTAQRAIILDGATFAGAVTGTGKAVYWDAPNNRFDLALADGSVKQSAVGFADVPNAKVYCLGSAVLFAGLTNGARYYLDTAIAGAITTVKPPANAVYMGTCKGLNELVVDIDEQPQAVISNVGQLKNLVINGGCQVAQRAVANLGTSAAFGQVDRFAGWASGTAVSAGQLLQDLAAPFGRTGSAFRIHAATITGAGVVYARQRIESTAAKRLKNQIASFSALVYHDVGSAINYTITIRKPTAADNFTSTTVIQIGAATPVATSASTQVVLANVNMGDCSNGIEIEIAAACGAVAGRSFLYTEWQLEEGAAVSAFERRDFDFELARCQRYFCKSYDYSVAPGTVTRAGLVGSGMDQAGPTVIPVIVQFSGQLRSSPVLNLWDGAGNANKATDYDNATWRDNLGAAVVLSLGQKSAVVNNFTGYYAAFYHYTADAEL